MSTLHDGVPGLPLPISGDTRVYVIIGDPIHQVGSPLIFNAAFRELGIKAVLIPLHVASEGLDSLFDGLRHMRNLDGIVVTVPHKMDVLGLVDEVVENGRRVGAVNAIRCEPDGRWVADNFDGRGCVIGLQNAGYELDGARVLLVGAGGAGSAVAHAFADAGIASIHLHDTDDTRLSRLADSLNASHESLAVGKGDVDPAGFDVVVNCTPLGMKTDDPYPVDPTRISPQTLVVDVILKPAMSPLLEACAAKGCSVQPGRRMLDGQAEAILEFFGMRK
ncbi:shikimate dehydrogenase family protein [Litchfieldella xinjiangensis]|uniref:shikimate dehydrogenase family protein n=1 Tax=Litchfieldella xinjiangensis TaxID=1166948 RepID=UPI0005BB0AA6|nr:ThiF family adenylyltransferase [Halomonas xinjiangensis]